MAIPPYLCLNVLSGILPRAGLCVAPLSRNPIDTAPLIVSKTLENVVSHPHHQPAKWFQYYHIYRHMNTGISSFLILISSYLFA